MTQKHFRLLAAAFKSTRPIRDTSYTTVHEQWNQDVLAVAQVLKQDNAKFDCTLFLKACGGLL